MTRPAGTSRSTPSSTTRSPNRWRMPMARRVSGIVRVCPRCLFTLCRRSRPGGVVQDATVELEARVERVRAAYEAVHAPLWRAVLAYSGSRRRGRRGRGRGLRPAAAARRRGGRPRRLGVAVGLPDRGRRAQAARRRTGAGRGARRRRHGPRTGPRPHRGPAATSPSSSARASSCATWPAIARRRRPDCSARRRPPCACSACGPTGACATSWRTTMPDPFDFDDARRALDEVPAPDLWDEASQRAAGGAVVPLDVADGRPPAPAAGWPRRRWRRWRCSPSAPRRCCWTTTTRPSTRRRSRSRRSASGTTVGGGDVCTGRHHRRPDRDAAGAGGPAAVRHVRPARGPARRPHDARLAGGRAPRARPGADRPRRRAGRGGGAGARHGQHLVRPTDFVQVRWFTGGQELCESFTVTVAGGTEDGNRHAAVDLAERVLLPSDLAWTT